MGIIGFLVFVGLIFLVAILLMLAPVVSLIIDYFKLSASTDRLLEKCNRNEEEAKERLKQQDREEAERKKLRDATRLAEIKQIFSPFEDVWPCDVHDTDFQIRKINRAYDNEYMRILDFYPSEDIHKVRAHVVGSSGKIYAVTPSSCECPSFTMSPFRYNHDHLKYTTYPCKHIYFLVLAMSQGFDSNVLFPDEYQMISDEEKRRVRRISIQILAIESEPLHQEIIKYLQNHKPVTMATLKKEFSNSPPEKVMGAVYKLVSIGSIYRVKDTDNPNRRCLYTGKP